MHSTASRDSCVHDLLGDERLREAVVDHAGDAPETGPPGTAVRVGHNGLAAARERLQLHGGVGGLCGLPRY